MGALDVHASFVNFASVFAKLEAILFCWPPHHKRGLDFLSNTVAYNGGVWVRRIQSLIYIICSFGEWCCTTNKTGRFIMGFALAWAAEALRCRLMPPISAIALPLSPF